MAPRAVWTGQMRLSLVTIGVDLYAATARGAKLSFRQIHEPTGKRVRHEKVVEGVGPVDRDEIVKGYEVEKGEYVLLDPEEIEEIKLDTKKTFELVQFVGATEIPPLYFDRPYYMVPQDDLAEDAYRVIRDALRQAGKIGLGQVTMRGKEHLAAVKPCGEGLLLETLRYEEEVRDAERMFGDLSDAAPEDEMLELAGELIEKKTKPFDPAAYSDSYADALRELLEAKAADREARVDVDEGGETGENVVDLMSALKKSVKGAGKTDKAS